jgi:3-oxoacyl-[acyl-carrier protein] reductase
MTACASEARSGKLARVKSPVDLPEPRRSYRRTPIPRAGSVDDIANAAVFLASEDSGWITGELIHVNGGAYMA